MAMTEQDFTARFLTDEAFRLDFKKDPNATMRAAGLDIRDGIEIEVVESTATKHYVVLPPLQTDELSDDQLTTLVGGSGWVAMFTGLMSCG